MVGTSLLTLITTAYVLYTEGVRWHRNWLADVVHNQVSFIEVIVQAERSRADRLSDRDWTAATLEQIRQAQIRSEGFGTTGEWAVARREGEVIRFLVQQRRQLDSPRADPVRAVPGHGPLSEAMQRAVDGGSGWLIGRDYRGIQALAAYAPIRGTDWFLVAKMDMSEVRRPFIRIGLLAGLTTLGTRLSGFTSVHAHQFADRPAHGRKHRANAGHPGGGGRRHSRI